MTGNLQFSPGISGPPPTGSATLRREKLSALILVMTTLFLLSGCFAEKTRISPPESARQKGGTKVTAALYDQHQKWHGVRYKMGGLSKQGIDCSGFVHLTFRNRFGIELPRSTEELVHAGQERALQELQPGDLLFFKTGLFTKHVGIYLENGTFLHASTSHGVMFSRLSHPYWSSHYWKTVRVGRLKALH